MVIVAVTGGLGTGKSTVAQMFAGLGGRLIDADELARECLEPETDNFRRAAEIFGADIVENGRINRAKLAEVVFRDPEKLKALESIVHPYVYKETLRRMQEIERNNPRAVVIWDIPLLFEKRFERDADAVVVVAAARDQQIERAMQRLKISREDVVRRLDNQMPMEDKIKRADFVIRNHGSLDDTRNQVESIWKTLQN